VGHSSTIISTRAGAFTVTGPVEDAAALNAAWREVLGRLGDGLTFL
jgi:hypothetical protein